MAVDTAHKRYSMIGLGSVTHLPDAPPDSDVEEADRLMFLGLYSGIAADTPVAPTATATFGFDDGTNYEWADNQFGFVDRVE